MCRGIRSESSHMMHMKRRTTRHFRRLRKGHGSPELSKAMVEPPTDCLLRNTTFEGEIEIETVLDKTKYAAGTTTREYEIPVSEALKHKRHGLEKA